VDSAMLGLWKDHVLRQIKTFDALLQTRGISTQNNAIFTFKEIAARGRHRFDLRLDVGPHWQDEGTATTLKASLAEAPWSPIVEQILGRDLNIIISVVYSRPGADAQVCSLHSPRTFLAVWLP
jgi:hypothetical protein